MDSDINFKANEFCLTQFFFASVCFSVTRELTKPRTRKETRSKMHSNHRRCIVDMSKMPRHAQCVFSAVRVQRNHIFISTEITFSICKNDSGEKKNVQLLALLILFSVMLFYYRCFFYLRK